MEFKRSEIERTLSCKRYKKFIIENNCTDYIINENIDFNNKKEIIEIIILNILLNNDVNQIKEYIKMSLKYIDAYDNDEGNRFPCVERIDYYYYDFQPCLWLLSFCILFDIEKEYADILIDVYKNNKTKSTDFLYENLIKYYYPEHEIIEGRFKPNEYKLFEKINYNDEDELFNYLNNKWIIESKKYHFMTTNNKYYDEEYLEENGDASSVLFRGHFSFEIAALVKIKNYSLYKFSKSVFFPTFVFDRNEQRESFHTYELVKHKKEKITGELIQDKSYSTNQFKQRDYIDCKLNYIDFTYINAPQFHFKDSTLEHLNFENSSLNLAIFDCLIINCEFKNMNINNSGLISSIVSKCNFDDTDLSETILDDTIFRRCSFKNTNIKKEDLIKEFNCEFKYCVFE